MPLQAAMLSTTQPAVTRLTLVISFDMQVFQVFYILDIFCVFCIFCIICMFHHPARGHQAKLTTMVVMGMIVVAEMTEMMITN